MKIAPLHRVLDTRPGVDFRIVHTGQHYDERMSDVFFRQLELPVPDVYMGVGSGSHAKQTGRIMEAFEEVLEAEQPDRVVVVGDVNSTLACSLVAAKALVPVAHIEAGLRSGDRTMPEEINRIVTDSISDLLFVTEPSGELNLRKEGVDPGKVHFVGNVMIDSLVFYRERAQEVQLQEDIAGTVEDGPYALATMHRPANVDSREGLQRLVEIFEAVASHLPIVLPLHPRTRHRLAETGLERRFTGNAAILTVEPQGYLEFLRLMQGAAAVLTDSGGIQEETTFLQVPCLTLRENTERPITVEVGTNELVPLDAAAVEGRIKTILCGNWKEGAVPPLWDGCAAERIADVLVS